MKRLAVLLAALPVVVLLLVVLGEYGVRAVYRYAMWRTPAFPLLYEGVGWEVPPWAQSMSILRSDPEIGLCMRPNAARAFTNLFGPIGDLADVDRMFSSLFPAMPAWAARRGPWHLRTNALGFRDDDVPRAKPPGTFRVAVLGDSWTVGVNVEREQAYPTRLADLLRAEFPRGRFEVLNFGVVGGTSTIGKHLWPRVLEFDPDLVVLAYAQNEEGQVRDETSPRPDPPPTPSLPLWTRITTNLELLRLLRWSRSHQPGAVAALIQQTIRRPHGGPNNELRWPCRNLRATATSYHDTIDGLVGAARARGVDVVLAYNNVPEFFSHCTLAALRRVAAERAVPLVDTTTLLFEQAAADAAALERARGLAPPSDRPGEPGKTTVVFRVDMAAEDAARRPFVMGNGTQLGAFAPNTVPLFDDGTHGDQVPNDRVWSRAVAFDLGERVVYLFTAGDQAGAWTGLENYVARVYAPDPLEAGRRTYLPIAQFGRRALRSDGYHADAEGYELIARALLEAVKGGPALHGYLHRQGGRGYRRARLVRRRGASCRRGSEQCGRIDDVDQDETGAAITPLDRVRGVARRHVAAMMKTSPTQALKIDTSSS